MEKKDNLNGFRLSAVLRDQTGTFQLDLFMVFLLGLIFALVAPKSDLQKPLLKRRGFVIGFMFNLIVTLSIAIAAYVISPDWMWMYWVDPKGIPLSHMVVMFGVLYPSWFLVGYFIAPHLDRAGWGWRIVTLVSAYVILFIGITLPARLWQVGTYDQFTSGGMVNLITLSPLSFTNLAIAMIIGFAIALPTFIGLVVYLRRLSD